MKIKYLPVGLNVNGKRVIVVGGGRVASMKIKKLLSAGARITVLSPALSTDLKELSERGTIEHKIARFHPNVLEEADLLIAATSSKEVNSKISGLARQRRIPVNVVDDPSISDFISLAVSSFGDFMIAVSTDGHDPGVSSRIRAFMDDHKYELAVRMILGRRTEKRPEKRGKVYITGAGPGDPELLTIKALALMKSADVIIKDYLIPDDLIRFSGSSADVISLRPLGVRSAHGSKFRQHHLNQMMVRLALEGKTIVRLKSGDPFIFGRGGEEVEYLVSQGIPVEVIPGITSALGGAASICLPLTHRKFASSFTIITGQEDENKERETTDWSRLPQNGTIVAYMPVKNALRLQDRLMEAGFSSTTPAVIVEKATHPSQRVFYSILSQIGQTVKENRISSPAILFIGETVKFSSNIRESLQGIDEQKYEESNKTNRFLMT
ncbi:MAG: uroporphyrinogen-III C-methyltransferase [Thermodesulfobacteriota bacterium]|nr:uroporphyrinogen-III C-methyltransferase [Thermodesulfobacteriota bacterium]